MSDEPIYINADWKNGVTTVHSEMEIKETTMQEKYVPKHKGTVYIDEKDKNARRQPLTASKVVFDLKDNCPNCRGTGWIEKPINLTDLINMAPAYYLEKINFIKAVRTEYNLGLKEAKEIVEAVQTLYKNLDVDVVVEGDDSSGY